MSSSGILAVVKSFALPKMSFSEKSLGSERRHLSIRERMQILRDKLSAQKSETVGTKLIAARDFTPETVSDIPKKPTGKKKTTPEKPRDPLKGTSGDGGSSKKVVYRHKTTTSARKSNVSPSPKNLQPESPGTSSSKTKYVCRSREASSSGKQGKRGYPTSRDSSTARESYCMSPPKVRRSDGPPASKSKNLISDRFKKLKDQLTNEKKKSETPPSALSTPPKTANTHTPKNISTRIPKRPASSEKVTQNFASMDCEELPPLEEMEWESISEIRRELVDIPNVSHNMNDCPRLLTDCGPWFVVIDTNVFIRDLSFVQELRDTDVSNLGRPVLYVPHRVFCELDALKSNAKESVARSARQAVMYINRCLVEKHPRLKGQSISAYLELKDIHTQDSDDKILMSCIQLKKSQPHKLLVFLSGDTNLRNKAIIEDIETFEVPKFRECFLNNQVEDPAKMNQTRLEARLKVVIQVVLEEVLQTECKLKNINCNNLEDVIDLFIKKWNSCFSHFLPVPAEEQLQKVKTTLRELEQGPSSCIPLLDAAKNFMTHFYIKNKRYYQSVDKAFKVFTTLRTRALDFEYDVVDEKFWLGSLRSIFQLVWERVLSECAALKAAQTSGDLTYQSSVTRLCQYLERLIASLSRVMGTPLFEVATSTSISDLAEILAYFTGDSATKVKEVLTNVCITIDGRNLILDALKVFQEAHSNCILTNNA